MTPPGSGGTADGPADGSPGRPVPLRYRHVAVEGPIGVGKSTFARLLARATGARFVADPDASNPYLEAFYRDPGSNALHAQLHFLVSRLETLDNPAVRRPGQAVVADFMIDKDRLFAELTLDETEWRLYAALASRLTGPAAAAPLPAPDLVVYLQAPVERLIERIERRGIAHEHRIDSTYLQRLSSSYERFFHDFTACPLLIVNTERLDPGRRAADLDALVARVRRMDGGRHFFNPG